MSTTPNGRASGTERFFRAGYNANLEPNWIPALDGMVERLHSGARVADVGCGFGASTMVLAAGSGAEAGEQRPRKVANDGGFTRLRRAAETPFNLVFEARS